MIVQTLTGVAVIAVLTQIAKSLLEAAGLDPAGKWHDPLIWLVALALGVVGYIAWAALTEPLSGHAAQLAAEAGFQAALMAIGTYHLVTHPFFGQAADAAPPAAP
jgi:protein-S-isoprenylcysteine O-methyltransferase Ste14